MEVLADGESSSGVEVPGEESAGGTIDETMNSEAEWPAEDSVDGDVITESNGEVD